MKLSHFCFALAATSMFAACEMKNETRYQGTCVLAYGTSQDTTYVRVNVDLKNDSVTSYQYDFIDPTAGFVVGHWVEDKEFAGGIALSFGKNDTIASPDNFTSIVGHGSSLLSSAGNDYTTAYYVCDMSEHPSVVMFYLGFIYGFGQTPKTMYVSNASYTYLAMRDGWTDENGTSYPPYKGDLYLRITALTNKASTATPVSDNRFVDVELASGGQFLKTWQNVSLHTLGLCYGLQFTLVDGNGNLVNSVPQRVCIDAVTTTYDASI